MDAARAAIDTMERSERIGSPLELGTATLPQRPGTKQVRDRASNWVPRCCFEPMTVPVGSLGPAHVGVCLAPPFSGQLAETAASHARRHWRSAGRRYRFRPEGAACLHGAVSGGRTAPIASKRYSRHAAVASLSCCNFAGGPRFPVMVSSFYLMRRSPPLGRVRAP